MYGQSSNSPFPINPPEDCVINEETSSNEQTSNKDVIVNEQTSNIDVIVNEQASNEEVIVNEQTSGKDETKKDSPPSTTSTM